MIAYSYLRFSTAEQSKGDSLRRQLEQSEKWAVDHGLVLDTKLQLHDLGISAFDKSNVSKGMLGGFLKAIEQHRIEPGSYLLVESLDRLSRALVLDALQQFISILNAGITIVTLADNQIYSKESVGDNWSQLIISISIMSRANEESVMKSKRVSAAWQKKLQDATSSGKLITKNVPKWFNVVNGTIQLIPERAEVVRRIFQLVKDGVGQHTIVRLLNEDTPAWSKTGSWQMSYVQKILTSPAVYGSIEINGTEVPDYFPKVLAKEECFYVRALRTARRTSLNSGSRKGVVVSNLFSGLLKCGYCNASMLMITVSERRPPSMFKSLVCNGAKSGATKCECVRWKYEDFQTMFLIHTSQLDISTLFGEQQPEIVHSLEQEKARMLLNINENKKKTINLYLALEDEFVPGLAKRVKVLEKETSDLLASLEQLEQDISRSKMSSSFATERRRIMMQLWNSLAKEKDELSLRRLREALSEQIHNIVKKIDCFPSGPSLNRAEKEMRFMRVTFKSGAVKEIAAS
jgi:DNA invertase Pin-like site-specific DNA recombinase